MKSLKLLIPLFFLTSLCVFPVVWGNWTDGAYTSGSSGNDGKRSSSPSIKVLVIQGAGHFLKSHSDYQLFLNRVELAELAGADFSELRDILNSTISSMESTNITYFELKNLAAATPYNQEVIEKLKTFDYHGFQEGKGFNTGIFLEVKSVLSKGNVTGAYESMFSKTAGLLERLNNIKKDIDNNIIPDIYGLWELNQKYSDALFFGQYTAMILKETI